MTSIETVTIYRPVGEKELDLIWASDWKRFPPRLDWQPIFYPVLTEEYAIKIARDWNAKDPNSGFVGYVLRFDVRKDYLDAYQPREACGREFMEYWIPADALELFNDSIVGAIAVIHEFRSEPGQARA